MKTKKNKKKNKKSNRVADMSDSIFLLNLSGCARTEKIETNRAKLKEWKRRKRKRMLEEGSTKEKDLIDKEKVLLNVPMQTVSGRLKRVENRRLRRKTDTGENSETSTKQFNLLKSRQKKLKFTLSAIEGWGVVTMERILKNEMVVEYIGEYVRSIVAEQREKQYEKMGIPGVGSEGSSYLFRVDRNCVLDATKKGNLARFVNHSCNPNCYARILVVSGLKRIVLFSKQCIEAGTEVTYDYKFPIEPDNKIPCLCGEKLCRKYLN